MARQFDFHLFNKEFPQTTLFCGRDVVTFETLRVDSRELKNNDGFVACVGHQLDGRQFIAKAVESGARLIIAEAVDIDESLLDSCRKENITCVLIENLNGQLSKMADFLFDHPSSKLHVVGVTGTNGKSSCVQMLAQALHYLDGCCWTMGTLGCGPFGAQTPNQNTTADAVTIQHEINKAAHYGCANTAMELSSHGLVQGRVASVAFNVAVFTNLSRDHLDYHKTMDVYGDAKRQLFLMPDLEWAVINVDDKFGRKLKKDQQVKANKLFISLNEPVECADLNQWLWVDDIRLTLNGIRAVVYTPWGKGKLRVPLIGRFNLYNLLSVIAVLGIKLQDSEKLFELINRVQSVTGRMQLIRQEDSPLVIVDYAHTPDALEQALKAAREHCNGKIITVFGCGGDRDPGKRPLMARVAEKFSNRVLFTDDNPRTEDPQAIINDMRSGLKNSNKVEYIADRKEAIAHAVDMASDCDVILVAGKGHEDYQIIGSEKRFYSDIDAAKDVLSGRAA